MLRASYGLNGLAFDYILLMFFNNHYTCIVVSSIDTMVITLQTTCTLKFFHRVNVFLMIVRSRERGMKISQDWSVSWTRSVFSGCKYKGFNVK